MVAVVLRVLGPDGCPSHNSLSTRLSQAASHRDTRQAQTLQYRPRCGISDLSPALWFSVVAQPLKLGSFRWRRASGLPAALLEQRLSSASSWSGVSGRAGAITAASVMAFGMSQYIQPRYAEQCRDAFFLDGLLFLSCFADCAEDDLSIGCSQNLRWIERAFYDGTRLLPILLVGFAVYLLVIHWRTARYHIVSFGLVALGYVAAIGPLLAWYGMNAGLYLGRGQGVLQWTHIPNSLEDLQLMWNTLWPLFSTNLLTVSSMVANDDLYYGPMMLPFEAALLALGVSLLVWRWRRPASFLLLSSGLGVLFFGGTLIPPAGSVHHWTPAFPTFYAAVALPVAGLAWAAGRFLPRRLQMASAGLLAVGLLLMGSANVHYYLTQFYPSRPEQDILASKIRFAAQVGGDNVVRSVGVTWQPYDAEFGGLPGKGHRRRKHYEPERGAAVDRSSGKGRCLHVLPRPGSVPGASACNVPRWGAGLDK